MITTTISRQTSGRSTRRHPLGSPDALHSARVRGLSPQAMSPFPRTPSCSRPPLPGLPSCPADARRAFIQAVTDRVAHYGLTAKKIEPVTIQGDVAIIAGETLPKSIAPLHKALEDRISRDGFQVTIEAVPSRRLEASPVPQSPLPAGTSPARFFRLGTRKPILTTAEILQWARRLRSLLESYRPQTLPAGQRAARGTNLVQPFRENPSGRSPPRSRRDHNPKGAPPMSSIGPGRNRLHPYEAGWLTLLLKMGVAEERELREAQNRVAQAAIDLMNERRERRRADRSHRRSRRKPD